MAYMRLHALGEYTSPLYMRAGDLLKPEPCKKDLFV